MINVDNIGIGERIKQKRRELGLTQEELADKCAISTSYVGHIERGSGTMSVNTLLLLANALNVSTDYLLFDSSCDDQILQHIASVIRDKPAEKKRVFYVAVKALADKIDEF